MRHLNSEMNLLSVLSGVQGVRQMIDRVDLQGTRVGVFEYLENDLHKFHLTDKRGFTLNQIKSGARQLLVGL